MSKKLTAEEYKLISAFWNLLKKDIPEIINRPAEHTVIQWSEDLNKYNDKIGFRIESDWIQLYIRSGIQTKIESDERTSQMEEYSRLIREKLSDQQPFYGNNQESEGRSIRLQKSWVREKKAQWPDAAQWVKEQFVKLKEIIVARE